MSTAHLPASSPNVCQVVVFRVADLPPERRFPDARVEQWRWELYDTEGVFLTGQTGASEEALAWKRAHNAAEALGYRP